MVVKLHTFLTFFTCWRWNRNLKVSAIVTKTTRKSQQRICKILTSDCFILKLLHTKEWHDFINLERHYFTQRLWITPKVQQHMYLYVIKLWLEEFRMVYFPENTLCPFIVNSAGSFTLLSKCSQHSSYFPFFSTAPSLWIFSSYCSGVCCGFKPCSFIFTATSNK